VNNRVGIGKTNPGSKLDVEGVLVAKDITQTNALIIMAGGLGGGPDTNQYAPGHSHLGAVQIFSEQTAHDGFPSMCVINKDAGQDTDKNASIGFFTTDTAGTAKYVGKIGFWPEDQDTVTGQFRIYSGGGSAGYDFPVQRMVVKSNGNVGIGTTDPVNSLHIYKAAGESTSGLLIEKASGAGGTAASLFFSTNAPDENLGVAKAGIFFNRNTTYGRGDILFCVNNVNDATNVGVNDAVLKITNQGYVQPGKINLSKVSAQGSLGGNYIFQAIYDAYRSGGQTGGTMVAVFQRYIQVVRVGSIISIQGYLPSKQSGSSNLNYRFTWAELGLDGQRNGITVVMNQSTSSYFNTTWSSTIGSDATYLTLTSTGQYLYNNDPNFVNYNYVKYILDMSMIDSY
jgi:hypothetical protein